jgi:hypothetical protein
MTVPFDAVIWPAGAAAAGRTSMPIRQNAINAPFIIEFLFMVLPSGCGSFASCSKVLCRGLCIGKMMFFPAVKTGG